MSIRLIASMLLVFFCLLLGCKEKPVTVVSENAEQTDVMAARAMLQQQTEGKAADLGKAKLSDYGFFVGDLQELVPAKGVIPYELNTPLFSDYAHKERFFKLPEGMTVSYREREVLDFPVGTYLIKNFFYYHNESRPEEGRQLMETRLLFRDESGWQTLPSYIWNEEQTEAFMTVEGGMRTVRWVATNGEEMLLDYSIPSQSLCKSCHVKNNELTPIGPKVRQLNRTIKFTKESKNQLQHYTELGLLTGMPTLAEIRRTPVWNDPSSGDLQGRALAYLDMNCSHCHSAGGPGNTSALHLTEFETNPFHLGIDKHPIAAGKGTGGRQYDIVRGQPDASILVYRMESTDPGEMMPEVARKLVHEEGVALIKEWIAAL